MDKKNLLEKAIQFHGHTGVFLAIGLKMGLLAKEKLAGDCFSTKAVIKTQLHPPRSCLLDGVQISTGCTLGKMNIIVEPSDAVAGTFTVGEKSIYIAVKDEFLQLMKEKMAGRDRSHLDDLTEEVMAMSSEDIFLLEEK